MKAELLALVAKLCDLIVANRAACLCARARIGILGRQPVFAFSLREHATTAGVQRTLYIADPFRWYDAAAYSALPFAASLMTEMEIGLVIANLIDLGAHMPALCADQDAKKGS